MKLFARPEAARRYRCGQRHQLGHRRPLVIDGDGGIAGCPVSANVRVITWDLSAHASAQREFRLILENGQPTRH